MQTQSTGDRRGSVTDTKEGGALGMRPASYVGGILSAHYRIGDLENQADTLPYPNSPTAAGFFQLVLARLNRLRASNTSLEDRGVIVAEFVDLNNIYIPHDNELVPGVIGSFLDTAADPNFHVEDRKVRSPLFFALRTVLLGTGPHSKECLGLVINAISTRRDNLDLASRQKDDPLKVFFSSTLATWADADGDREENEGSKSTTDQSPPEK